MRLDDIEGDLCARCCKPFEAKSITHRYCCKACRIADQIDREVERYRAQARAYNAGCTCPRCGKVFDANTGNQKFCSPSCATQAVGDRKRGKMLSVALAEVRCQDCGGPIPDAITTNTLYCRPCGAIGKKARLLEACRRYRERNRESIHRKAREAYAIRKAAE